MERDNSKSISIPIYCINLPQRKDRKTFVTKTATDIGLSNLSFFDAVDGRDEKQVENVLTRLNASVDDVLSPGEKGCLLSHACIWREIADENIPYALILEDDVCFVESFIVNLLEVLNSGKQMDGPWVLYCGYTDKSTADLKAVDSVKIINLKTSCPTHCYLMSTAAARTLLSEMQKKPTCMAVDHFMFTKYDIMHLKRASRSLCHQNFQFVSDIQSLGWTHQKLTFYLENGFPYQTDTE